MNKRIRYIALMMLTAVWLGSCGHDDATQDGGGEAPAPTSETPIVFSANEQEGQEVTRAGGVASQADGVTRATNLGTVATTFTVFGFKNMGYVEATSTYTDAQTVFPGYTVNWQENTAGTSTTNSHDWEYVGQQLAGQTEQTVKYWDWSAKAYRFFGVGTTYDKVEGSEEGDNYKVIFRADARTDEGVAAIPYYSHLWFSTGNTTNDFQPFGEPVTLTFLKPVAQVRFMFIFEDPADDRDNTDLDDIKFMPTNGNTIKQKGNLIVRYPLKGTGTEETFTVDAEATGITAFTQDYIRSTQEKWYHVFPCEDQGTYTLNVSVNGLPKTAFVPAAYMVWKPGYQYTYIFKVHVDGGVSIDAVQSAFTSWTVVSGDKTVYNW